MKSKNLGQNWLIVAQMLFFLAGMSWGSPSIFEPYELSGVGGNPKFSAANFSYMSNISRIREADFDGDGDMDFVALAEGFTQWNQYTRSDGALQAGDYLYHTPETTAGTQEISPNVQAGRVGDPEGTNYQGSDLAWFENDGAGYFRMRFITGAGSRPSAAPYDGFAAIYSAKDLAIGDLNGDSRPDIVVFCNDQSYHGNPGARVVWYRNTGLGNFVESTIISANGMYAVSPRFGTIADMDNDGREDIVVMNWYGGVGSKVLYWIQNDGTGTYDVSKVREILIDGLPAVQGTWSGNFGLTAEDLDGDGHTDLIVGQYGPNPSSLMFVRQKINGFGFYDGTAFEKRVVSANTRAAAIVVADMNHDGRKDIIAAGPLKFPGAVSASHSANARPAIYFSAAGFAAWHRRELPGADQVYGKHVDFRVHDFGRRAPLKDAMSVVQQVPVMSIVMASCLNEFSAALSAAGQSSSVVVFVGRWRDVDDNGSLDYTDPAEVDWQAVPVPEPARTSHGVFEPDTDWNSEHTSALALGDFNRDGQMDFLRSNNHWPLFSMANTWNRAKRMRIVSEIQRGNFSQRSVSLFPVNPDNTVGRMMGDVVETR